MKYCLSSRQNAKVLEKADEIFVQSRDYRQIPDLFVDYPDKMIILEVSNDQDISKEIEQYAQVSENFCCCIYDLQAYMWYKERNIKFYYGYPISTYYDVYGLIDLGVEYIKIMAPLTFDMDTISKINIKFRMVPNVAYDAYIPRENGLRGQWVRPEDVKYYEDAIYIFEFENVKIEQEKTLHHIYAEEQTWPGNLNILFTNFNVDINNRAVIDEIGEVRSKCRQRCMSNGACHLCQTMVNFEKMLFKIKEERKMEKEKTPEE